MTKNFLKFLNFILYMIFFFLIIILILNSSFGLENINFIKTFSGDEHRLIRLTESNVYFKNFSTDNFYFYGYLYNYISFLFLTIFELLGQNIQNNPYGFSYIGLFMRLLSVASSVIFIFFLHKILINIIRINNSLSLSICLIIFTTPEFIFYSMHVHPDTLQLMFFTIGLWYLLQYSIKNRSLAYIFFGLSLGTKYNTALLLPIISISELFFLSFVQKKSYSKISLLFLQAIIIVVTVFIISNPTIPLNFAEFFNDIQKQSLINKYGHGHTVLNKNEWFEVGENLFGEKRTTIAIFSSLIFLSFVFFFKNNFKNFLKNNLSILILGLYLTMVSNFIYFYFFSFERELRYLFLYIPIIAIIIAFFLSVINNRNITIFFSFIFIILCISNIYHLKKTKYYENVVFWHLDKKYYGDHEITKILSKREYIGSNVLYERGYINEYIEQLHQTKNAEFVDLNQIYEFKPNFIILRKVMTGRICWKADNKLIKKISTNDLKCNLGFNDNQYLEVKKLFNQIINNEKFRILYENDLVIFIKLTNKF